MLKFDFSELKKYNKTLEKVSDKDLPKLMKIGVDTLADAYLGVCKSLTPVLSGNMRKNWGKEVPIKDKNCYKSIVYNNTNYASFVDSGHRTRNNKSYVEGRHITRRAETHLNEKAGKIIEKSVLKHLERSL